MIGDEGAQLALLVQFAAGIASGTLDANEAEDRTTSGTHREIGAVQTENGAGLGAGGFEA